MTQEARHRRVTLRDVALRANVHVSTASRVLNDQADRGRISADTEQRIRQAATELGYLKDAVGRALRTGRTGVIGMLVPDIGNLYQSAITQAAATVLADRGYSLLLASTDDRASVAELQVAAMIQTRAEGFLYGIGRRTDPALASLSDSGVPVVLFNRSVDGADHSTVLADDRAGIDALIDHLVSSGHRTVAHVGGPVDVSSSIRRLEAFDLALERHGLRGFSLPADRQTEEEGKRIGAMLLDRAPELTAIVAANDRLAIGVIQAVRERGLTCPHDVSVTGFNDMPYADLLDPPLTTVRISQEEIGIHAASLLVDAITNPDRPSRTHLVGAELRVRGSTGPAAPR